MNYTGIFANNSSGLIGYALETFDPMQPWFWVMFFGAIIGYIYCAMNSVTATVVAILITLGVWATAAFGTDYLSSVPVFNQFLYIIVLLGLTLLVGTFIMKRRF
jgi:hypothetical protein